ncbi:type I-C CRISPR-associated protein Cas8c/Csd1 [Nitrosomonas eutropha]|uniref:type I-C CRISPR-associated protein Cas8c/Csd1 n=1 Tax=Nitrosomonas eutropha TaxID=916 RepID=UPI0008BB0D18|nr:type I-C CRISPR-associated protein Cas8c/Csd1 [Nitrosomonas eutropha]SEI97507.1 CRISPR-associated protein, Csd1 family [Nitrosomonas eutropha]
MILQALCKYYERKPDLPRPGFEIKPIPFIIEINADGRFVQIEDTRTMAGKKKIARSFLVPQGVKKTSGIAANPLWDTTEYVLGVTSTGKPERVQEQHAAFLAKLEVLANEINDAGLNAICTFLHSPEKERLENNPLWSEIRDTNSILTFRLSGDKELVCQRPAVYTLFENASTETEKIICLITGKPDHFERLHTAIKGVWGAQTSGANIVSFNKEAFNSFAKEQGANAPVGKHAAFAYTTALNHLLSRESTQRIQVGDASTVFWSEQSSPLEDSFASIFDEPPKDDPARQTRAIEALFKSPETGTFSNEGGDTPFYVLGLAPNAARISVRFWLTGTAAGMSQRIRRHFEDLKIVHASFEKPYLSLFRLLVSTAAQGKSENIPPNLAGDFMRAILEGLPYPQTLLAAAVRRIRAEREITCPRASLIKACLNRQAHRSSSQEKEITVSLDNSNTNPGYRTGRLFAALEKIQEESSPGLNATIRDRFYGAASSTPVTVFANLMKLKNHHLAKLEEGRKRFFEKLIGEIMASISDFPAHLNLADQGRFAIGYYHQRQAFFTKSEPANKGE